MRNKLAVSFLMAAMTASLLAGCGDSKSSDSTKADSAQTTASNQSEAGDSTSDLKDGKTEELLMVWPGSNASPADMQAVEDAMNEIIGEKVDAKVKLQIIEWGAYNDQTNLMLSSGEKLDMVFLMSNIREDGQRGQLYPINDLVETYAPDAYSAMERYIEACYFDGDLYGLPRNPLIHHQIFHRRTALHQLHGGPHRKAGGQHPRHRCRMHLALPHHQAMSH